ncbi:MAG: hypothetical protein C0598_11675 [Marinilabiliales bacterium]|nr:MAG: hypothetical protein C0598_11675 [Marinilabiliales bacterium]
MKKIKLLIIALGISFSAFSQIELAATAGYMFGGSIDYYEGKMKIYDNMSYGGSLILPVKEIVDLEINYTRMDSRARFTAYRPGYNNVDINHLNVNYLQIGTLKTLNINNDMVRPFGSFSLGAAWFQVKDDVYSIDDVWQFSITAGLGAKVYISERVGLIFRGRFMLPINFTGVGFYYGIGGGGSGGGLSLNSYAQMVQIDLSGGLVIRLGN